VFAGLPKIQVTFSASRSLTLDVAKINVFIWIDKTIDLVSPWFASCGLHALNNSVQQKLFSADQLDEIFFS
jgi:hypothetical protein